MKEENDEKNNEETIRKPVARPNGDLDDFIFSEEGYMCSEK